MTRLAWAEPSRASGRAAAWIAGGVFVAGVPAGLLWVVLAPRAAWVRSGGSGYFADGNSEALVGADNWFFFVAIVLGALSGALACHWVRSRGPLVAIGLLVGSLAAAVLAATIGHVLTQPEFAAAAATAGDGKTIDYFLTLRARSALFAWPLAAQLALLLYTFVRWPQQPVPAPSLPPESLPPQSWATSDLR